MADTLPSSGRRAGLAGLGRRRFALLLTALIALLLVGPMLGDDPRGEVDLALFFSAVVLGFASAARRVALAMGLAAAWLVLIWLRPFGDGAVGAVLVDIVLVAICLAAIESALTRVFRSTVVDEEVLCAAVSVYVLLGVTFAGAYSVMETLDPSALAIPGSDAGQTWQALLYFSFVTLTTLGYGDVLPVLPLARSAAMLEAAVGTIYLAILVARLVSNYRSPAERRSEAHMSPERPPQP